MKTRMLSLLMLLLLSICSAHGMIKRDVLETITTYQSKMLQTVALLQFRYDQSICVKHHPNALLPVEVVKEGECYSLDDVADIAFPEETEDDLFIINITPHEPTDIDAILLAITNVHPEFRIKVVSPYAADKSGKDAMIVLTMPEVTMERQGQFYKITGSLYNTALTILEKDLVNLKAEVAPKTVGYNDDELKEVDDEIDRVYNDVMRQIEGVRKAKEDEIDWGHNIYVKKYGEDE